MFPSAIRRSLGSLIPPKIATPGAVSSGTTSTRTADVIAFYSKLPKGPRPASEIGRGIKARYFEGKNASGMPVLVTIFTLFCIGYTVQYNLHLKHHKTGHH
ncbi:MAG: ATP synthase f chain, mitochondrial precursor [Tremellales sp. Tagirdzhanova-0007]|nr:MAG: ATP synthase f chain, mitochondrial precursor [Tremellales sp. Tagirdzhanova-0007]